MSNTCLVIGCSGQDGSLICQSLINHGHNVIGTTRKTKEYISSPENHEKLGIAGKLITQSVAIEDLDDVVNLLKNIQPDHIYNFSAQSSVGLSFHLPNDTQRSIVDATSNLLEACRIIKYKGKIFFSGSSEIFGETQHAANIKSNIGIYSPYAASKYQSLIHTRMYREIYGINAITGIFFNHESYLRNENFVTQKIIRGAIACSKNKNHQIKLGNIEIARDWGWAEEFMEGVQIMMNSNKIEDQIICTGKLTTLKEFIKITFDKLGLDWKDHIFSDKKLFRNSDIKQSFGDPQKMEKDLGWKAKVSINEIIEKLINYHLNIDQPY